MHISDVNRIRKEIWRLTLAEQEHVARKRDVLVQTAPLLPLCGRGLEPNQQIPVLGRHEGKLYEYLCFRELNTGRYWVASVKAWAVEPATNASSDPLSERLQLSAFIDTALDLLAPGAKRRTYATLEEAVENTNDWFLPSDEP